MTKENKAMSKVRVLLSVRELSVAFPRHGRGDKTVVKKVSFDLAEGEILGIAGESGSGKSMTALAVMGLLPENAKRSCEAMLFDGKSLCTPVVGRFGARAAKKQEEALRLGLSGKEMAMIFQEPLTSLNPVQTIGTQMEEPLLLHTSLTAEERKAAVLDALSRAELKHGEHVKNCIDCSREKIWDQPEIYLSEFVLQCYTVYLLPNFSGNKHPLIT